MTPPIDPAALSLEQKVSLLSGRDFWTTKPLDEAGLPSIVLTDGPHGIRRQRDDSDPLGLYDTFPATCFPPAVAVGSSWDAEIAERLGAAVGREARAFGVAVVLGPGVNIKRSPLCGRNFEYYSEDPLLSGVLGAAHVRGLQAQGVGASVKHFAANNQETARMSVSADVDERTLREIYLPAFERVVTEARPATVMAAYNSINGIPASQNRWLLTDVLRDEWGFTGVVVSDWGAVYDRVAALGAGLDLEMPGSSEGGNDLLIVQAVRAGALSEDLVDASARRVAGLAGLEAGAAGEIPVAEHHALARELAAGCAVLLRNERNTLPLDTRSRIAVIGQLAAEPRFQGGGSSHISPTRLDIPLDAIRALGGTVAYAPGYAISDTDEAGNTGDAGDRQALIEEAVKAAGAAEVAIVFAGSGRETEGADREDIDLPAGQVDLIRAVAAAAPRTVVVLSNGGVVSLEGWHDDVDAILEGWLLGQAAGGALADLLFGITNPSGHLAETIPLRLQDTPSYLTFPGEQGHVRYGEGVMVGYRHYETVERAVRYPFGHGLSYTTFATTDLTVTPTGNDSATVRATVTNTGDRTGRHVVQLYVATATGPVRRPTRELRAFTKLTLAPGEAHTVELLLDRRAFAYYDTRFARWSVPPGDYTIQIGESAAHIVAEETVTLDGDGNARELTFDSSFGEWLAHPVVGPRLRRSLEEDRAEQSAPDITQNPDVMAMVYSMPVRQLMNGGKGALNSDALTRLMELSAGATSAAP